jgi:hypothetical protein
MRTASAPAFCWSAVPCVSRPAEKLHRPDSAARVFESMNRAEKETAPATRND